MMARDDSELPKIVSREDWEVARQAVAKEECDFSAKRKTLVERWNSLPMTPIEASIAFEGSDGRVELIDIFEGRRLLLVYHFWFQPGEPPCEGCSLWTSNLGDLGGNFANLRNRDASLAFVSRASAAEITKVKEEREWAMPWYSLIGDAFDQATGFEGWAQISVLVRDGGKAFLANFVPFDDLRNIGNHWSLLERAPFGVED